MWGSDQEEREERKKKKEKKKTTRDEKGLVCTCVTALTISHTGRHSRRSKRVMHVSNCTNTASSLTLTNLLHEPRFDFRMRSVNKRKKKKISLKSDHYFKIQTSDTFRFFVSLFLIQETCKRLCVIVRAKYSIRLLSVSLTVAEFHSAVTPTTRKRADKWSD